MGAPSAAEVDATRVAARVARKELAPMIANVEARGGQTLAWLPPALARVIGLLYAMELRAPDEVLADAGRAQTQLREALALVQPLVSGNAIAGEAAACVADALAVLFAAQRGPRSGDARTSQTTPGATDTPDARDDAPGRKRRAAQLEIVAQEDDAEAAPRERVSVELDYVSDANFYAGFSGDVTWGGVFVPTYKVLPVGSEVVVRLGLPDGYRLESDGRVAWTREPRELGDDLRPGMGIAFRRLSSADRAHIDKYVARRPPIFYES